MRITGRDWSFIVIAGVIFAILMMNAGKEKPKKIPGDKRHRALVEWVAKGGGREEAEKVCATCHNPRVTPLPPKHPPKEQCLLCHGSV